MLPCRVWGWVYEFSQQLPGVRRNEWACHLQATKLAQPPQHPDSCSVILGRATSLKIAGLSLCQIWICAYWQCWCDRVTLGSWELYVLVMNREYALRACSSGWSGPLCGFQTGKLRAREGGSFPQPLWDRLLSLLLFTTVYQYHVQHPGASLPRSSWCRS